MKLLLNILEDAVLVLGSLVLILALGRLFWVACAWLGGSL